MKLSSSTFACILLVGAVFAQSYEDDIEEVDDSRWQVEEQDVAAPKPMIENIYDAEFFPAVAIASFTGPSIVGEFSFYQDAQGDVTVTGAVQKGLIQDAKYQFRFHEGPSCDNLGAEVLAHSLKMHVVDMGGTPPIQELIPNMHLTGSDGFMGLPWVLSDDNRDLACVVLKGPQDYEQ